MNVSERSLNALGRTTLLIKRDIFPILSPATTAEALTSTRVRLAASDAAARGVNGQTAIATSAILCMQMGMEVALDFTESEIVSPQPPLGGDGLRESLLELSKHLTTPAEIASDGDFTISIGLNTAAPGVAISGDDWGFRLSPSPSGSTGFSGSLPFGSATGANAAAAEAFRHAVLSLSHRTGIEPLGEHPIREARAASYRLPSFHYRAIDLASVDSISAGALATSALYLVLRLPGLRMQLRLIDDDNGALSNLNRYLLLHEQLLGIPKVEALKTYETAAISIEAVPLRFEDSTLDEIGPLASRLLVGVDDIPSRWLAQDVAEGWVGVAATSHFEVVVSEHTRESPCASCLHPHDEPGEADDIPTVSFVSAFSGFLLAHRLLRSCLAGPEPSYTLGYPFNLAGERPVSDTRLVPHPACKVVCAASEVM